ncbi:hypothetical protein [Desulfovibrio sp.]|uniref:hypothetical protein n=1 Tax=Desulfovibrio sp. TaxID=885 RepID=UPI0025C26370|nr:hypothetical protein [Desulfovibrio sp.]
MNAFVLYVGDSKGGVGKSAIAFALVATCLPVKKRPVSEDSANLDVSKAHLPQESMALVCKLVYLNGARKA